MKWRVLTFLCVISRVGTFVGMRRSWKCVYRRWNFGSSLYPFGLFSTQPRLLCCQGKPTVKPDRIRSQKKEKEKEKKNHSKQRRKVEVSLTKERLWSIRILVVMGLTEITSKPLYSALGLDQRPYKRDIHIKHIERIRKYFCFVSFSPSLSLFRNI